LLPARPKGHIIFLCHAAMGCKIDNQFSRKAARLRMRKYLRKG
jgi:hypothetical protein